MREETPRPVMLYVENGMFIGKEMVFCKDCRHKVVTKDGEWNPEDIVCDYWASDGLDADDFCSRGERKKPTEF